MNEGLTNEDLKARLENLKDEFRILNAEKKAIESKGVQNYTEEDVSDLEVIEQMNRELVEKLNNWGTDYNAANVVTENNEVNKDSQVEVDELTSIMERQAFYAKKVKGIVNESKAMQPKFESNNKKYKKDILERNGFVETSNADGRKVYIHPSLVGQYFDLVKVQRELNTEYHQEKARLERQQNLANRDSRRDVKVNELKNDSAMNNNSDINEGQDKEPVELTLDERIAQIEKRREEILKSGGRKIRKKIDGVFYDNIPRRHFGEFSSLTTELSRLKKQLEVKAVESEDKKEEKPVTLDTGEKKDEDKKVEEPITLDTGEKKKEEHVVTAVRKPTWRDKIKKHLKKFVAIAMGAVMLATGGLMLHGRKNDVQSKSNEYGTESSKEGNSYTGTRGHDDASADKDKAVDKSINDGVADKEMVYGGEVFLIGATVNLNSETKLYGNALDSARQKNAVSSEKRTYDNNGERKILGVSILDGDNLVTVFPNQENANGKIREMIDNGGVAVGYLVGKESASNGYNGEVLSNEKINALSEGFVNAGNVYGSKNIKAKGGR